jgi:ABC-type transport system substrate-binding protein
LFTTGGNSGEATLAAHRSAEIPKPENRWLGTNRGGWSSPEFDRAADAYAVTLDRAERVRLVVQMARIFTEDAAVISLYFNPAITAFASGLTGPRPVVPEGEVTWNIQTWEFR